MSAQRSLFNPNTMTLQEQIEFLQRQLKSKCSTYHISFGIFKTKKGNPEQNALVVLTDNNGIHFTCSLAAESITDMFTKVNDALLTINQPTPKA